ncbi:pyruvate dehydrogenase complex dihydrolipoamide acetyltransferase [Parafrigoribacterium mesophilum]|uniref:dihydrolipoamide acetyltransferase family protein n=1 Tax=Parafrigoribacterium mesophilum TaxID=433646 RepID=UPI0031FD7437
MPEVIMPRLSDTMEEGELTRWLKNVGDEIHKGDVLAEIETDKATMDLEAFENGVLEKQLVTAGTVVPIGQAVAVIGDGSNAASAPAGAGDAKKDDAKKTEPAKSEPEKSEPGTQQPGTTEPAKSEPAKSEPEKKDQAPDTGLAAGALRTSPLARKIARDHDIDLASVTGTGPQGRIVRADIEAAIAAGPSAQAAPAAAPAVQAGPDTVEVPINNIRKVTARRLTESQAVPHFFLTNVVDAGKLIAFRKDVNESLAASGGKVSINDLIVRAVAVALRAHPEVNSSWGGDKLLRHNRINIGIAVALPDGLIVPVVQDADRKSLGEIAQTTVALAEKARAGKLKLDEMSGGTFTISNLGMFGIDEFTAVINPPEAAILAVGAAVPVPEVRDGQLVEVPKMKITLTVDHRVLDGAMAAAFLRDLKGILEAPLSIVL